MTLRNLIQSGGLRGITAEDQPAEDPNDKKPRDPWRDVVKRQNRKNGFADDDDEGASVITGKRTPAEITASWDRAIDRAGLRGAEQVIPPTTVEEA